MSFLQSQSNHSRLQQQSLLSKQQQQSQQYQQQHQSDSQSQFFAHLQQHAMMVCSNFISNKLINYSLLQQLCNLLKIHTSISTQQIDRNISILDDAIMREIIDNRKLKHSFNNSTDAYEHNDKETKETRKKGEQKQIKESKLLKRELYNMLNVLFFNLSATNEHYLKEIQNDLIESTAQQNARSRSGESSKQLKMAQEGILILKQHIQQLFGFLLCQETKFISHIIRSQQKNCQNSNSVVKSLDEQLVNLLQTIDYLCVKYNINNSVSQTVIELLQRNPNQFSNTLSVQKTSDFVKQVNKLLFTNQRHAQFYHMLETSPNMTLSLCKRIANIINSNYTHNITMTQNQRKLFNDAQLSGKEVLQKVVRNIIKRIDKNELFTEKLEQQYMPFRLVCYQLSNRYCDIWIEFNNNIIEKLMVTIMSNSHKGSSKIFSIFKSSQSKDQQLSIQLLKQIQKFFRIFIPIQNPQFHKLLRFIYEELVCSYSDKIAIELLKKLILNRFLLNPIHYIQNNNYAQNEKDKHLQIERYVTVVNQIRILFYPKKVQQTLAKNNLLSNGSSIGSDLLKISEQIQFSFENCLMKQRQAMSKTNSHYQLIRQNSHNNNGLYINDKILIKHYKQIHEQLLLKKGYYNAQQNQPKSMNMNLNKNKNDSFVNIQNLKSEQSLSFSFVKNSKNHQSITQSKPFIQNVSQVQIAQQQTNRSSNEYKDNHSLRYMYNELKKHHHSPTSFNILNSPENKGNLPPKMKSPEKVQIGSLNLKSPSQGNFNSEGDSSERHNKANLNQQNQTYAESALLALNNQQQNKAKPDTNQQTQRNIKPQNQNQNTNRSPYTDSIQIENPLFVNQMQIVQELVSLRKQYGEKKRQLERKKQQKRQKRQMNRANRQKHIEQFQNNKKQIERTNNLLFIEISIN